MSTETKVVQPLSTKSRDVAEAIMALATVKRTYQMRDEIAAIVDQALIAECRWELLEALEAVLKLMDDGILVRDTRNDDDPAWAIKQFPLVLALQKSQAAIAKAKGVKP